MKYGAHIYNWSIIWTTIQLYPFEKYLQPTGSNRNLHPGPSLQAKLRGLRSRSLNSSFRTLTKQTIICKMYVPGLRIWAVSCKMTRPEAQQMKYFAVKKDIMGYHVRQQDEGGAVSSLFTCCNGSKCLKRHWPPNPFQLQDEICQCDAGC